MIKMPFNESLNVSCNIWHCKNYSQNAWGKLRTAVAGNLATPKKADFPAFSRFLGYDHDL